MNIGGYDATSFNESDGNALLTQLMQSNKLIKTHFTEADKTPNFDGFFEICESVENKVIPIGRFNVQIKTIDKSYINENKKLNTDFSYKYSCDSKIFNAVLKGISLDPAFLLLIDIQKSICFGISITEEYVLNMDLDNEEHKTVYFNDADAISNVDKFYQFARKLYNSRKALMRSEQEITYTLSDNIDRETRIILQNAIDRFNNLMDNELDFIKQHLFNDVWKFGIAYSKGQSHFAIGIYKIRKGDNGVFIRIFDYKNESNIFVSSCKNDYSDPIGIINDTINLLVKDYFLKNHIKPAILPDVVLNEIAFDFLDEIATSCKYYQKENFPCVYNKDSEDVLTVENFYNALLEMSCNCILRLEKMFADGTKSDLYIFDPLKYLHGRDITIQNEFYELTKNRIHNFEPSIEIRLDGVYSYDLLLDTIIELKNRRITAVSRLWKHKDLLNFRQDLVGAQGYSRIETCFRLRDYYFNLDMLFNSLSENFEFVAKRLFGKNYSNLKLSKQYIIWFPEKDQYYSYVMLVLKAEEFSITVNPPKEIEDGELDFEAYKNNYENLETLINGGGMANVFNNRLPLLKYLSLFLYKSLSDSLNLKFDIGHDFTFIFNRH